MNLAVDFGNTRIKAALFNGQELYSVKIYPSVKELTDDNNFHRQAAKAIISSVTGDHEDFIKTLKNKNALLFGSETPVPLKNLYKSASTLGSDRIAASVGAFTFYPDQNVLTIDAGTCIKYNFVNKNNEYLGGAISPGFEMRLKAMNHYTSRLPLITADLNYEKLTGTDTRESLLSGALIGATCEADSMIERYLEAHENLTVVVTGGDADYLCKQLKNRFFAHPYLVLYGLNAILNFNVEN